MLSRHDHVVCMTCGRCWSECTIAWFSIAEPNALTDIRAEGSMSDRAVCPPETRRCLQLRSGIMFGMPDLVSPVVPVGRLRDQVQPRLIVDELVLRPWEPEDATRVVEAYSDPAIQKWHARSMTEPEALSWVMSWSERWTAETGACRAVVDRDLLVGRVGLRTLDLTEGAGEAAYWVMPDARGRGVATRALRAATAWMFTQVGLHRIESAAFDQQ